MNSKNLFTNKAEYYAHFRPLYAQSFIEEMLNREIVGLKRSVADIGAGTGILTKQLALTNSVVFAVEPNESMLKQAHKHLQGEKVTIMKGTAENIPLKEHSVDAVFAGQAFHWFDPLLFRKECKRILYQGKPVVLVWNRKLPGEMEDARKRIVNSYEHTIDSFHCSWNEREEGISAFFHGKFEKLSFPNDLVERREEFIGRTLSASHAVETSASEIDAYLADWNSYFDAFQQDGIITIKNETVAFIGIIHDR